MKFKKTNMIGESIEIDGTLEEVIELINYLDMIYEEDEEDL